MNAAYRNTLFSAAAALAAAAAFCGGADGVACAFVVFPLFRSGRGADESPRELAARKAMDGCVAEICAALGQALQIYNRMLVALFRGNARLSRETAKRSAKMAKEAAARRSSGLKSLRGLRDGGMGVWVFGARAATCLAEVCESLDRMAQPACEHVDSGAEPLTGGRAVALMRLNDAVDEMMRRAEAALSRDEGMSGSDTARMQRDVVLDYIGDCMRERLGCCGDAKDDMLLLTLLGETKVMVLGIFNLINAKRYYVETSQWERG